MNALDKIREAKGFLESSGIVHADREAEIIVSHFLGINRLILYKDNPQILEDIIPMMDETLKRRSKREPLQYILGYTEFFGLKIKVGPGVLIPRPETELLVKEAIKVVSSQRSAISPPIHLSPSPCAASFSTTRGKTEEGKKWGEKTSLITPYSSLHILDLCTGSGCLALALAREFLGAQVYGTDTSEIAIKYARENAKINEIKNVTFLEGSLFDPIKKLFALHCSPFAFDVIVSNPPYIRRYDIKGLQSEIKDWEPVEALDGGEDGLDYYRIIIPGARDYLKNTGFLLFELGINQADAVKKFAEDSGFQNISLIKDYAGIERILMLKKE
jgi:release factor glutamine methyltransferase